MNTISALALLSIVAMVGCAAGADSDAANLRLEKDDSEAIPGDETSRGEGLPPLRTLAPTTPEWLVDIGPLNNNDIAQHWYFRPLNNGSYQIINRYTGGALHYNFNGHYYVAYLTQPLIPVPPDQQWFQDYAEGGWRFLRNAGTNGVLDIIGISSARPWAVVAERVFPDNYLQLWSIRPLGGGYFTIVNGDTVVSGGTEKALSKSAEQH